MAGLSKQHEQGLVKHTDKIIELCGTDVALIDDPDCKLAPEAMRATLIAIRNNCMMIEDFIQKARESQK